MKREEIWHEQRRWLTEAIGWAVIAIVGTILLAAAGVIVTLHPRTRVVSRVKVERRTVYEPAAPPDLSAPIKAVCAEAANDQILRHDRERLNTACRALKVMSAK